MILGQRLGEWCGHGPALELDMALTNISLDLFGQTRSILQYAAEIEGLGKSEDDLAFFRLSHQMKNVWLVEQPNGDFAHTLARQVFMDRFNFLLYGELKNSRDERIAAIAEKSLKEVTYHQRFSGEWLKRLGDGTEESHTKMQIAVNDLWEYTGELFIESAADSAMSAEGIGADLNLIKGEWESYIVDLLKEATLDVPETKWMQRGGKDGQHTEHLGLLLAEMQSVQRAYPGLEW